MNSVVSNINDLLELPIRTGAGPTVFDPRHRIGQRQHRHSDGVRAGERPARRLHSGDEAARTRRRLTVVSEVKANLGRFQALVPDDIKVSYELDQSRQRVGVAAGGAARGGRSARC